MGVAGLPPLPLPCVMRLDLTRDGAFFVGACGMPMTACRASATERCRARGMIQPYRIAERAATAPYVTVIRSTITRSHHWHWCRMFLDCWLPCHRQGRHNAGVLAANATTSLQISIIILLMGETQQSACQCHRDSHTFSYTLPFLPFSCLHRRYAAARWDLPGM